jgi:hypothetical protein
VVIYESGRDHMTIRIDDTFRSTAQPAQFRYLSPANPHISAVRGHPRTVDDPAVLN